MKRTLLWTLVVTFGLAGAAPSFALFNTKLTPGKYSAELTPRQVDDKAATNIKKLLSQFDEVSGVNIQPSGVVEFTVKDGNILDTARIDHAIKAAAPDYSLGTPKLEKAAS